MILVGFTVFLSQLRADVNKVLVESIGDASRVCYILFFVNQLHGLLIFHLSSCHIIYCSPSMSRFRTIISNLTFIIFGFRYFYQLIRFIFLILRSTARILIVSSDCSFLKIVGMAQFREHSLVDPGALE